MVSKKKRVGKKQEDALAILRQRIAQAPQSPGIYKWLDKDGAVLYVGKAKNLRNRLRSYVQPGQKHSPWKDMMVRQIRDVDTTVVNSDLEAIVLETNLIKELKPKYNIMMKDDKHYVYVRITMKDPYPRIDIVRKMEDDGALYFGPKTSAEQARSTLGFLRKLFPFRTCTMEIMPKEPSSEATIPLAVTCLHRDRPTPCLDHHIKQCCAPCVGKVTPAQYRERAIDGVIAFLSGKRDDAERMLEAKMKQAAEERKFERAAELRNQLQSLRAMNEKQLASDTSGDDADIIGVALHTNRATVVLFRQRDGKLLAEENFSLQGNADSVAEVLDQFLPQYYLAASDLPDQIILSDEPGEADALVRLLNERRGKKTTIRVPQRGKKSSLLLLAEKNARWKAEQSEAKWEADARRVDAALTGLQEALELSAPPRRIEGYDISHLGGTETVGSMTVMIDGKPRRDHYRSFTIRSLKEGDIDDYASLREVLRRRLAYLSLDLKTEQQRWKDEGVVIGKARKADVARVKEILKEEKIFEAADLKPADLLVARRGDEIVGCVRLFAHPKSVTELTSLWVHASLRGKGLGRLLARLMLRRVKKGKVYVTIDVASEQYYASLGFQHVITEPSVLRERLDTHHKADAAQPRGLAMMYQAKSNAPDPSFTQRPDLLLIDGGKGQLGVAVEVLDYLSLSIPVAALAKREEELFVPGNSHPVDFPKDAPALFLLRRLRDEAHRFANSLREKKGLAAGRRSVLDTIPGIGPATKKKLQKMHPTISSLRNADDESLLTILSAAQLSALHVALRHEEERP